MSKSKIIAAAGAFALAALASTAISRPAMADTPHCLHQVNPYVACTDRLKAKTPSPQRAITHSQFHVKKLVDATTPIFGPVRRLKGH
jgi:hypothetical protein